MNRILIPTDFSPHADKAVEYGLGIARKTGASIRLLHVTENMEGFGIDNVIPAEEIQKGFDSSGIEKLNLLKSSIESTESVMVETEVKHGAITESILNAAKECNADLIVVGTFGVTGLKEALFGSKTAALIGQSSVPIIAIPLEYEGGMLPAKFLLAIHDAKEAGEQLELFYELAKSFHATITLTSFTDISYVAPTEYPEEMTELVKAAAVVKEKTTYLMVDTKQLLGKRFIDNINQFVLENGYNLVVMTTHERSLLSSIINPSLTKKMSYKTKVPLLALPVRS